MSQGRERGPSHLPEAPRRVAQSQAFLKKLCSPASARPPQATAGGLQLAGPPNPCWATQLRGDCDWERDGSGPKETTTSG